ncbi:hypothetical protein [Bradyrhizobium stylosanthis]|uniref:Uncharacterized protein n=1 Tax=Bradyrhizobium stylosanthis TaxID=1803665 RepID=A0A560CXL1_9BRAD|nr:hypothetical protein [Bradyrhizobium stylosanthis]TWA89593.1 hypothetical protein FBZ96_11961 [Bradyrhizobium stylosanthis]
MQTHDLGQGWFINIFEAHDQRERAFATVRNPEKGQRIDLPSDSFDRLRDILKSTNDA